MVFKSFRLVCILRILLIAASIYLFFYLIFDTELIATTLIVGLLSLYQFYSLFQYVEKTNRELSRFLDSIKYSDFSQTFSSPVKDSAFRELHQAFTNVIEEFQHERKERVEHFQYLQTVVEHVPVGLLTYRSDGELELINKAAKKILNISNLRHLQQLNATYPTLVAKLLSIQQGKRALIKIQCEEDILQLSIFATNFVLHGQHYRLVSIQNIQSELEEKEMEAWQNLIRVLTHEIMNSITPISSLASTTADLLPDIRDTAADARHDEIVDDIHSAIKTIQKRSNGLLQFVDNYRKLTRIPKPNFEIIGVAELIQRVTDLSRKQMENYHIELEIEIEPESLEITADPVLIEQVLINLCKNAIEAVRETDHAQIRVQSQLDARGHVNIHVQDNGPGIKPEVLDKIFIPFFTTKQNGSGIGLSLSRQIMRLHGASIGVKSNAQEGTKFTLRF